MTDTVWKTLVFSVPAGIPSSRFEQYSDAYKRKAGAHWETQGYQVLEVKNPALDLSNYGKIKKWGQPDRDFFVIYGLLRRAPRKHSIGIDTKFAPLFTPYGYKEQ